MSELERELVAVRDAIAWPETPDVGGRLRLEPQRARWPRLALVAVVAALVAGLAVSPAGASLLRWIGISSTIRVTAVERLPLPRDPSGFGRRVTPQQARALADFPLRVAGRPRRVRFSTAILGGAVTLDYPDATVTEFAGDATGYLEKLIAPPARARRVRVNGSPGVFVAGGPTQLIAADRDGQTVEIGGVRRGMNVLLFNDGDVAVRLETRRDLAGALALALMLERP